MGPLDGLRVVEVASLGPGPFCAMLLADLGADVLRVERRGGGDTLLTRGRGVVTVDLKEPAGLEFVLRLVERADALIEGFRPGVAERLGIGPDECRARNAGLVYGRMTGWGQDGELSGTAGHDINYIAQSGVLSAIGREGGAPTPPLNLLGDFGGGGLLLAFGILAALWERQRSGEGQVVDAAMVDGAALLATMVYEMAAAGAWEPRRGTNLLDTGAPFYDVYETADGGWLAVGSLEPQFFAELVERTGIEFDIDGQYDRSRWPDLRGQLADRFASRSRAEWEAVFRDSDGCVSAVLDLTEAPEHPANAHRRVFVEVAGAVVPAPAPRFSRTAPEPPGPGGSGAELEGWGFSAAEIAALSAGGIT